MVVTEGIKIEMPVPVTAVVVASLIKIPFITCAVPAMLMLRAEPVAPTVLVPPALMFTNCPVKAVIAPDSVISISEPTFAPAVVMPEVAEVGAEQVDPEQLRDQEQAVKVTLVVAEL